MINLNPVQAISMYAFFVALLFITGAYCLIVTRNILRAIIGIEILIKAATLLIIAVGYITNNMPLAQSLAITVIVIEVVIVVIAGGIGISIFRHNGDLDVRKLRNLKG